MWKTIPLTALAVAGLACSGSSSLSCPANTQPAGGFTLGLNLQHTPDECVLTSQADGGPPPADASIVPGTQSQESLLCAALTDGGPTLFMVVANSGLLRRSLVDADGGFTFVSPTLVNAQTLCNCAADVDETIRGSLAGAGDGGFTVVPDAGLVPPPTAISGTVVQSLTAGVADGGCLCNAPCAEHYTLTGTLNR
ncbi:MAG TPA: hypothetical protein VE620_12985 [Myxococcales bacterium]|jgi:hypothetical protein|nr:hypothetical protein [Myxococcales bacterium]